MKKRLLSVLLIMMMSISIVPVRAEETEIITANEDIIHVAYSDNMDENTPQKGNMQGTAGYVMADEEHGRVLVPDSSKGSGTVYFHGDIVENSLMDIISFELYCENNKVRAFSELFSDIDSKKSYYENYKRIFYIKEGETTTFFKDFKSSGYSMNFARKAKQWYRMDIAIDYVKRSVYYYIDGEQIGTNTLPEDIAYYKGFRYKMEPTNGGGAHYIDNVQYIQVLKRGYDLGLGDNISYPETIENMVGLNINTNTIGSILFSKEAVFDLEFENYFAENKEYEVKYQVIAENGTAGEEQVFDILLDANEKKTKSITIEADRYGFNTVEITITDKNTGRVQVSRKDFSCANGPKDGEKNPKMGYNNHANTGNGLKRVEEATELFAKAGYSSARGAYKWSQYERNPGVYSLVQPEILLAWGGCLDNKRPTEAWIANGIKPYVIVSGGHSVLSPEGTPTTEASIKNFANYAYHLASDINALGAPAEYEVWNEYNHIPFNENGTVKDYVNMLKETYPAIKKGDPDAFVWGMGGVTKIANLYEWIEEFLQLGGQNYCDGFSFHPYTPNGTAYDSTATTDECIALFEKYGCGDMPLSASEIGWTSNSVTEMQQAAYEIETAAMNYDKFENFMWYVDIESQSTSVSENKFGSIRAWDDEYASPYEPFSAKPVFLAMANFNRLMTGAKSNGAVNVNDTSISAFGFKDKNNKDLTMLWSVGEKSISLKMDCESVTVSDMYGNETEMKLTDGVLNITVGDSPIYIIGNYSTMEAAEVKCNISTSVIETTVNDKLSLNINKKFSDKALIQVNAPKNITVLENNGFDDNDGAEIVLSVGENANDGEEIEIILTDESGEKVLFKTGIPIEYKNTMSSEILASYFRSKRWQGSIKIKNNKQAESISGVVKITKPEYLAKYSEEIRFEDIAPMTSKEILFNIPETLADVKTTIDGEVVLDNGEKYALVQDIYYTSFIKTKTPPEIDGELKLGEWNIEAPFALKYASQVKAITDWRGVEDVSGNVYFMWDNECLYMAAEIKDDILSDAEANNQIWAADSIQFAFAKEKVQGGLRTEYGVGILNGEPQVERYAYMGIDTGIKGVHDKGEFKTDTKLQIKRDEERKITTYEMSVPWYHIFGEDIKPGSKSCFYFSMLVNDNDGAGRRGWIEYCPGIGSAKNPALFIDAPIKSSL